MTDDEREIRDHVLHAFSRWGDADAYAACFTEGSDYVAFDGGRGRGRAENVAMHRPLFEGVLWGTRLVGEIESARTIGPDQAIVHASGGVAWPWQRTPSKDRLSRQTFVLVRAEGRWSITAFHNTRIAAVKAPPAWLGALFRSLTRLRARRSGAAIPASYAR